jgi:hypothetical protein
MTALSHNAEDRARVCGSTRLAHPGTALTYGSICGARLRRYLVSEDLVPGQAKRTGKNVDNYNQLVGILERSRSAE